MMPTRLPRIGLGVWKRPVHTLVGDPEQLYTLAEEYVDEVRQAGGMPLMLPPMDPGLAPQVVASLDALVLTGGGDFEPAAYLAADKGLSSDVDPEQDGWDLALARAAREAELPFFGICRGMQALNIALGGTLIQDIGGQGIHPPIHDTPAEAVAFRHPVRIVAGSRLAAVLGVRDRNVNSIHHQAIGALGKGLVAVAHAPDGVIEAVEYKGGWSAYAVQWHPERTGHTLDQLIFDDLVRQAETRTPVAVPADAGRQTANRAERQAETRTPETVSAQAGRQTVNRAERQAETRTPETVSAQAGRQTVNRAERQAETRTPETVSAQAGRQTVNRAERQAATRTPEAVSAQAGRQTISRAERQAATRTPVAVPADAGRQTANRAERQAATRTPETVSADAGRQTVNRAERQAATRTPVAVPADAGHQTASRAERQAATRTPETVSC